MNLIGNLLLAWPSRTSPGFFRLFDVLSRAPFVWAIVRMTEIDPCADTGLDRRSIVLENLLGTEGLLGFLHLGRHNQRQDIVAVLVAHTARISSNGRMGNTGRNSVVPAISFCEKDCFLWGVELNHIGGSVESVFGGEVTHQLVGPLSAGMIKCNSPSLRRTDTRGGSTLALLVNDYFSSLIVLSYL